MNWTKSQIDAIEKHDTNIIVSAGAGSGKTAVLTERVVYNIKNRDIKVDEMLILTFTNASALEMRNRIKMRLLDDVNNYNLVDSSYITTFDSFCLSIVKRYNYLLDVDEGISSSPNNLVLIKKQAQIILRKVFEEYYANEDELFLRMFDDYGNKNDNIIFNAILNLNDDLGKYFDKDDRLNNYNLSVSSELVDKYKNCLLEELRLEKRVVLEKTECLLSTCSDSPKHLEVINELFKASESSINDFVKFIYDLKLPRANKQCLEEYKTVAKEYKEYLKKLKPLFSYVIEENKIKEEFECTVDYSNLIARILKELNIRLEKYKKENQIYDFNDIEKLAITVIKKYPEVQEELRDCFKEIMIDEYQDTNDIQEMLIDLISNNNVYQVGDIKQSIYRFRNANPLLFKSKYDKYQKEDGGIKIDLLENFRSRKEVIENTVNPIFSEIMTEEAGDADYKNHHQMVYGNKRYDNYCKENSNLDYVDYSELVSLQEDKDNSDDKTKLLRGYNKTEIEILYICQDINKKINDHYQIVDNEGCRDAKFSDFTVMCQKGTEFYRFKRIFEFYEIPLNIKKDEKINQSYEFDVINSILNLIYHLHVETNNSITKQKYYLTSILRSFIYNYDDETIYNIIKGKYYDCEAYQIAKNLSNKLDGISSSVLFDSVVKEYRIIESSSNITSVDALLSKINFINGLATTISKSNYSNLDFIEFIKDIKDDLINSEYSTENNSEDAVTMTTIHKAKGLQYSICYIISAASAPNYTDTKSKFIYYNDLFVCPTPNEDKDSNGLLKILFSRSVKREIDSEYIRLYYVALTRAKEKLVLFYYEGVKDNSFIGKIKDIHFNKNLIFIKGDFDVPLIKHNYKTIDSTTDKKIIVSPLEIEYSLEETKHFSKAISKVITKSERDTLDFGTKLHECLEMLDFKNPSQIENFNITNKQKEKLFGFLNQTFIKDLKDERIFKEFEFIDNDSIGIIDLMIEYDDHIKIIDYKTSNINDPAYAIQLKGYKDYLKTKTKKPIKTYLYSIMQEIMQEIETQ